MSHLGSLSIYQVSFHSLLHLKYLSFSQNMRLLLQESLCTLLENSENEGGGGEGAGLLAAVEWCWVKLLVPGRPTNRALGLQWVRVGVVWTWFLSSVMSLPPLSRRRPDVD